MKPPPFNYFDPAELAEALQLLADSGPGTKILAGGQSLMPLLNLRLTRPATLVDINRIEALHFTRHDEAGLHVGATIRQTELLRQEGLAEINPLLAEALPLIGHRQTRSRGTVCGSLAFGDPSAELPAVAITLGAKFTIQNRCAKRTVPARNFFKQPHLTIMDHDEMLTGVTFPAWNRGDGWAIEEIGRRPGDFALAGVAVLLTPANGICARARITVFGTADIPRRSQAAETLLIGNSLTAALLDAIVARLQSDTTTQSDIHATSAYRRYVLGTLTRRALLRAAKKAGLLTGGFNG